MTQIQIAFLLTAMLTGFTGFTVLLVGFRIVHTENVHFRSTWGPRVGAANNLAFGSAALALLSLIAIAMIQGMNPEDASCVLGGFTVGLAIAVLVRWLAGTRVVCASSRTILDAFPLALASDAQEPAVETAHL